MFVYVGAITSRYVEPKPPLYERPAPLPREGNMGEQNEGIAVFELDERSGKLTHLQAVTGLRNPSYLALHPARPVLYAAERETTTWGPNETLAGAMTSLTVKPDGTLSPLGREPAPGGATYISIHPTGSHIFAAIPSANSVAVFPVRPDGSVDPPSCTVQRHGRGVNTITLERPYQHCVRPDNTGQRVFACDLGLDQLVVYDFVSGTGRLEPAAHPYGQLSSGAGPRHLWVHPNNKFVYVVNEVDATVSTFDYDANTSALRIVDTVRAYPDNFRGVNTGAQIVVHPSGRFVYSSNRGHNSIAMFAVDQETGRPRLLGFETSQGDTPRNFNIDPSGRFLVVANVNSNNLVSFHIDQATGRLTPAAPPISTPNPVCVLFSNAR
jgi:6-phosphogluconolactonase